jgi:preprotein translocase subunit SecD
MLDWILSLLVTQLSEDHPDVVKLRRIALSAARSVSQLTRDSSVGLTNVLLKRRDTALASVPQHLPDTVRQELRSSLISSQHLFDEDKVVRAEEALRSSLQRVSTLQALKSSSTSASSKGKSSRGQRYSKGKQQRSSRPGQQQYQPQQSQPGSTKASTAKTTTPSFTASSKGGAGRGNKRK